MQDDVSGFPSLGILIPGMSFSSAFIAEGIETSRASVSSVFGGVMDPVGRVWELGMLLY